ncbi:MAG: hypothetical protein ACI9NC_003988, partial [Verrucomicrobiales bacterium]
PVIVARRRSSYRDTRTSSFLCDEPPVPAQYRIGSHDGRQFHQRPATESLCFDGQNPSLVVGEEDALAAHSVHQRSDLRILKFDNLLLLTVDQAREDQEEQLPGAKDEVHGA